VQLFTYIAFNIVITPVNLSTAELLEFETYLSNELELQSGAIDVLQVSESILEVYIFGTVDQESLVDLVDSTTLLSVKLSSGAYIDGEVQMSQESILTETGVSKLENGDSPDNTHAPTNRTLVLYGLIAFLCLVILMIFVGQFARKKIRQRQFAANLIGQLDINQVELSSVGLSDGSSHGTRNNVSS